MSRSLPQLAGGLFLTDGGLETTLIFHDKIDLPLFAAFVLLKDEAGRETLRRYYESYLEIAAAEGLGFVLEAPTWRASPDWAERLGMSPGELELYNRDAIRLLRELKAGTRPFDPELLRRRVLDHARARTGYSRLVVDHGADGFRYEPERGD